MSANTNIGSTPVNQGYVQLIHTGETGGIDGTLRTLYDGDGTASDLQIASNAVKVSTTLYIGSDTLQEYIQDTVGAMLVTNASHTNLTASYDDVGDGAIDLNAIGSVNLTGTINANEFPQFHDSDTLKALTATEMRSALNVDVSGTDNSTNVTLVTTSHDYLSISGQAITLGTIDISDDTNLSGGAGITLTGDSLSVSASQTSITSIYNSALQIGSAADEQRIDFGTSDEIRLGSSTQTSVKIKTDPLGSAQDEVIIGDGTADVDFVVDNTSGTAIFKVDAGTGNTSVTGDLNISGSFNPSTITTTSVIATNYKHTTSPNNNAFTVGSTSGVEFVTNVDITGGNLTLEKGNGALLQLTTSESDVQVNDALGSINFFASNETGLAAGQLAASILAQARGTFDNSNNPTDLIFKLGTTGTASEKFRIFSSGGIKIGNAYTLPSSDGSANQILKTNGSGTLSFADESTGISFNGSTANGLLTYGNSTTADVESGLTYDGSTLAVTGDLNVDSNTLFVDSSADSVGIGTNSPERKLHVTSGAIVSSVFKGTSATGHLIDLVSDNATDGYNGFRFYEQTNFRMALSHIQTGTRGYMQIGNSWASGSEILVVDGDNSRVGIGTSSPSTKMHIKDASNNVDLRIETDKVNGNAQVQYLNDARQYNAGINNVDAWGVYDATAAETRFTINTSGNVGIGTASPASKLDLGGSTSGQRLTFSNTGVNTTNGARTQAEIGYKTGSYGGAAVIKILTETQYDDSMALAFHTGTSAAETMRIDSSQRVGIGTTTPGYKLDVVGTDNNAGIRVTRGNSTSQQLFIRGYQIYNSGNHLLINAADTKELRLGHVSSTAEVVLDSSGNFGVGATNPGYKLNVKGASGDIARFEHNGAVGAVDIYSGTDGGLINIRNSAGTSVINLDARTSSNSFYNHTGNFGIGNASPAYKLDVSGDYRFKDTSAGGALLGYHHNDSGNGLTLVVYGSTYSGGSVLSVGANGTAYDHSGNVGIDAGSSSIISLGVAGNEKMRIKSDGKIGINGDTTDAFFRLNSTSSQHAFKIIGSAARASGRYALQIDDNDTNGRGTMVIENASGDGLKITTQGQYTGLQLVANNDGSNPAKTCHIEMTSYEARANGTFHYDANYSGEEWFSGLRYAGAFNNWIVGFDASGGQSEYIGNAKILVDDSGNLHADADVIAFSTTTGSDRRLKKNIKDLPYGLDDVLKLRAVEFDWKEKRGGKHDIGVIAQEIQEVIPEVVNEVKTIGKSSEELESHLSVDYGKIVSVLIKAVQEQQEQINKLEEKLNV